MLDRYSFLTFARWLSIVLRWIERPYWPGCGNWFISWRSWTFEHLPLDSLNDPCLGFHSIPRFSFDCIPIWGTWRSFHCAATIFLIWADLSSTEEILAEALPVGAIVVVEISYFDIPNAIKYPKTFRLLNKSTQLAESYYYSDKQGDIDSK